MSKKRIVSVLLSLLLLCCNTIPVAAAGESKAINAAFITVDAPATGNIPAATASLSAGSNGTVNSVVQNVAWSGQMDVNGTFMPRVKYTVTFTLGIAPGSDYYFSDKENSFTATVNGKEADEVLWYANDRIEVIYTFPAFGTGNIITKANITMATPEAGKTPALEAHIPATASTYVKSIFWEGPLDGNGCFQPGTEYTAYLTLGIKEKGRRFSKKSFDAIVNGVTIDSVVRNSDTEIIIPVEFEATPIPAPAAP